MRIAWYSSLACLKMVSVQYEGVKFLAWLLFSGDIGDCYRFQHVICSRIIHLKHERAPHGVKQQPQMTTLHPDPHRESCCLSKRPLWSLNRISNTGKHSELRQASPQKQLAKWKECRECCSTFQQLAHQHHLKVGAGLTSLFETKNKMHAKASSESVLLIDYMLSPSRMLWGGFGYGRKLHHSRKGKGEIGNQIRL